LPSAAPAADHYSIFAHPESLEIDAGILTRQVSLANHDLSTTNLAVSGNALLSAAAPEISFTISSAEPDRKPKGLLPSQAATLDPAAGKDPEHFSAGAYVTSGAKADLSGVAWVHPLPLAGASWRNYFDAPETKITRGDDHEQRAAIQFTARKDSPLAGLRVQVTYEIFDGFPAIRKWVEIANHGAHWLKLDHLVIDDRELAAAYRHQTPLTPGERGAGPSVIGFADQPQTCGIIAVSEIPSALRLMKPDGAMGYADELFEWALGPGESFQSEPVFDFGFSGQSVKTISAVSTPLDRAVEGPYLAYLHRHIGIAADHAPLAAPLWCSWSNFGPRINDAIVREMAVIAARCGFTTLQLDLGWQKDAVGAEPDTNKFPDFAATSKYVHSLGLKFGLWTSCYRAEDSPDVRTMPENRSLPLIKRDGGFAMSFASPWKNYFADELAALSKRYDVDYFKQDYTGIKFGDDAEGHESRTLRESYLRGLRGLFDSQDRLREKAPGIAVQITHEIYWGTPGVPCDLAVLKHATSYHIPPNDYAGQGIGKTRVTPGMKLDPLKLRAELLTASFKARERLYAQRGLPLYCLEYYGAHAVNINGDLTRDVQDRQVCGWLMGSPAVFAGDLASLTNENIRHYRELFDLLKRLENDYDIYRHFQFSGVPAPTDQDWHWWGKLDATGSGAVVVMRGSAGEPTRAINIPWVQADRGYQVNTRLKDKSLGQFTGRDLQSGALHLDLPPLGQEILELRLVPKS
jgi:hypothetical protein